MPKVSVTLSDEQQRISGNSLDQNTPLESGFNYENCTIKSFRGDSNIASIELENGELISELPMLTSLGEILMFWGEPKDLKDIPGVVFYRIIPEDGFVVTGRIVGLEVEDSFKNVNEPFSL